ncbi:phospholipid-translocating P-type ATPase [Basidiobolus meristosporus CBS 931.73]|uniref:Phospholipid-transporting ATPase n=1 Tax=Basidiobolus meristosporus CBS 931.73 TaxID=1314790 RepID=A0A1Y1XSQ1_9FUNG|nr:phospholipid-translocating P-type ATPase [Basidiobolus meristosporus CBS 931.73]|eukprot:ORX88782.1 phospholipid-translocating P-type ATPase [Basidiobolus meristosporus CBS 931.73]
MPSKYLHNRISTAKYNFITFLPKFLFEQFSKYSNVFFLFTACIQQIKDISPTSKYTTLVPLLIVLAATAFKEIVEDYKRHQSDAEVNARDTKVLQGTAFVSRPWRDIVVGDIVRIEDQEFFPADLALLSSSEPEAICYIETSNLDGETNLKVKQGLTETADILSPLAASQMEGYIKCEQPNNSLYTFDGTLVLLQNGTEKIMPLDPTQILLRGAQLRNTPWVYGVVVFTGHESKLMRNASATPIKRTDVEKMTNTQIIFLFGILLVLSLSCALGTLILRVSRHIRFTDQMEYLALGSTNMWAEFGKNILTFLILFNNLIPISLTVTMEVVKYQQAALINSDLDIYYAKTDTPALARTSSLVEELGQIEYIFSDKTGTLTCNEMEFRQCSIAGIGYADVVDTSKSNFGESTGAGQFDFKRLIENLHSHPTASYIDEFLTLLATCHTVIPEKNEKKEGDIIYQASSPDEGALVEGASVLDFVFTTRRPKSIRVRILGEEKEFEVLNICEFNSTRKRMSAIIRGPDGKIKLYCKGADTVILERLGPNNPFVDTTLAHLEDYASEGLRTLCIAVREIPEEEYRVWCNIYDKAATTLVNRQDELDKAAEMIEKDLFLLGATAIEDKLQDGVPDTIHTLAQAGIKIWVLTGDRQETAVNIGYSCKLLTEDMRLLIFDQENMQDFSKALHERLRAVESVRLTGNETEPLALIITGYTLDFALHKDMEVQFLSLATKCKAVICCRVSPLQKALVVKLVKRHLKTILLAIGDGANDVSMIQAAHVGVGISGMEGLQAARSADFAISQFRFLKKLLLVHGAWSYQRLSKLILYSFYKNITLYMTQFWFAFYNGFSGQTVYESWTISLYNVLFTVMPPMVIGVFDQFVSARMLDRYPEMYQLGQRKEFFNVKTFWGWTGNAFYHSLILFFFVKLIFKNDAVLANGDVGGQWVFGTTLYTSVLATVLLKAALVTDLWTKYTVLAIPGSFLIWIVFFPIYAEIAPRIGFSEEYDGIIPVLYGSAVFWFTVLLVPTICVLRDYTWKYLRRMYFAKPYHCVQEIQKFNIPDYRPRMERFRKAVHKVRAIQRMKLNRGFAFSQNESGQAHLIRAYDTTHKKPQG